MAADWDDVRIFLAIGRTGSLSAAANVLGLHQSTVSRRLAALEKRIGTPLLDRGIHGRGLTAAGNNLMAVAHNIEAEMERLDYRALGGRGRLAGRLRVTCTDNFAIRYLAPHFARFCGDHPQVDLEIATRYQHLDLARREADVAIRTTVKPPQGLVGRRLLTFALAAYASPAMVERLGVEPDPAAMSWIGWESEAYNRIMITDHFPTAKVRHRVDSLLEMSALACEGLGVAVLGCFAGDTEAGLRRVYREPITDNAMDLWVLWHPDMRNVARVRAFTRFIAEQVLADRDLFEGQRPIAAPANGNTT